MPKPLQPVLPNDLVCLASPALTAKLASFRAAGANQLQVVFDFDRTLTIAKPGTNEDITAWSIMKKHLAPEGQARYQELFEHYRALELAGTMTQAHAVTWWSGSLDLFVEYGVNLTSVEREFLSHATIRPGTKALFDVCTAHDIPTIILSAGVRDVIELWAAAYHVTPTVILSTALRTDSAGIVSGWDADSLVHVLNKKEINHPELTRIRSERRNTILIGDGLSDADMAEGTEDVFRIRVYDPRVDEATSSGVRDQTLESFDAMIETGSLLPVQQLLEQFIA